MSLSTVVILIFYTCSQSRVDAAKEGEIFGPPTLNPKGRPRTTRISGRLEGRLRGEEPSDPPATVRRHRCGLRREEGQRVPITRGPAVIITSLHNYSHLHNSVNTEDYFFGRDVTSHLIKHSFPLLSSKFR